DAVTNGPAVGGSRSVALILNHTFSPTLLLSASLGFTRNYVDDYGTSKDFPSFSPVKTLGLPAYINASGTIASPNVTIGGGYVGTVIGSQTFGVYRNGDQVYQLLP